MAPARAAKEKRLGLLRFILPAYRESSDNKDAGDAALESTRDPTSERYLGVLASVLGVNALILRWTWGGVSIGRRLSSAHAEPGGTLVGDAVEAQVTVEAGDPMSTDLPLPCVTCTCDDPPH